jgi:hypothetical protein
MLVDGIALVYGMTKNGISGAGKGHRPPLRLRDREHDQPSQHQLHPRSDAGEMVTAQVVTQCPNIRNANESNDDP